MTAHHHGDTVPERRGEKVAQLAAPDEADALVLGHAEAKDAPRVVDDAMGLPDLGQADARGRMRVDHARHVWPGRINPRVDPELGVRRTLAGEDLAIRVEDEEIVLVGQPGTPPRGEQKRRGAGEARTHVAEGIGQPEALDDAIGEGDVMPKGAIDGLHGLLTTRCRDVIYRRFEPPIAWEP